MVSFVEETAPNVNTVNIAGRSESSELPLPALVAALGDLQLALLIFDDQLNIQHATGQVAKLIGIDSTQAADSGVLQLLSRSAFDPASIAQAKTLLSDLNDAAACDSDVLLVNRDQDQHVRMRIRKLKPTCFVASFEATAQKERAGAKNGRFAQLDSLTGLLSRSSFEEALKESLARQPNEPLSVLLIDLDRFKAVNDTLGHPAGDAVLKLAAERLKSSVRKTDIVARLGGDEFAVLVQPSPTAEEPKAIAKRILDLVQRTYFIEGQLVNIGTSIGIAQSPDHGSECSVLMKNADLALYQSKIAGRGMFHFFETYMEQRAQARRTSELELRRALALRQLEVFYQPQVNTALNRLVGFESLIRWRHPEKGLIPPSDFLPIAEEIGVIVPIGDWVLRTACREAMNWPDEITIAVNASPLQFDSGNFADSVKRALSYSGLPGKRLEIEITEGILLRNDESVLKTLHNLRAMGVRVAMDDFGTGYASLSQLARFPFDKIKIDRSLAGFEGHDPKQRAIVRAITSLGQSLGVCTLAEGVESSDQIERLKLDGCTSVQGYFYSRPIPAKDLEGILSQWHPASQIQGEGPAAE